MFMMPLAYRPRAHEDIPALPYGLNMSSGRESAGSRVQEFFPIVDFCRRGGPCAIADLLSPSRPHLEGPVIKPLIASLLLLLAFTPPSRAVDELPDADARSADVDWLITQIESRYAYLPQRHVDLARMRALYVPQARQAGTWRDFIHVVESVIGEMHDDHFTLGTNTPTSPQLIPTGTDMWAQVINGRPLIMEVRPDGPAKRAGIAAGDLVISINGVPALQAIESAKPKTLTEDDAEADNFTLRRLLAGNHQDQRRLELEAPDSTVREVTLEPFVPPKSDALVTWRWLNKTTGYIRIENSLGDSDTVALFDQALRSLRKAKSLILDLRNTPSGGSTDVAEPIMGRFISKKAPYQRVFEPGPGKKFPEDSWLKEVEPRAPLVTAKLVVLSDHFTGSMGEGMTIGLDALGRAKTVGTRMAGLCGGTEQFVLPHSEIPLHFPTYRLYRVSGEPRELYQPSIYTELTDGPRTGDPLLTVARGALQ
jgi:C-terminal processing protease CtpA/Prc